MENRQDQELLAMREQLHLLKEKLDKEVIVNDHLLREVTRQKVRRLNRNVWQEGFACLFVITFGTYVFHYMHLSWWFIGATILMMVACFLATLIPHRRIKMNEIMSGDLLTVAKQVRRLKRLYREWLRYGIPAIVVWMGWFSYEIIRVCDNRHVGISMIIGGIIGGVIGGAIGLHNHKKLIREMDELIEDIEQI